jgi:hypothetical protein
MVAVNQNAAVLLIDSCPGRVDRWTSRGRWPAARKGPTAEDLRVHAWLCGRLAAVHRERHGLRAKLRRLLSWCRLVRS